jgi:hypothetical protein
MPVSRLDQIRRQGGVVTLAMLGDIDLCAELTRIKAEIRRISDVLNNRRKTETSR